MARISARLCALPTALRLDPHILAIIARLLSFTPHGHERVPERLQRSGAQDRRIARYRWVVQHPVTRLSQHRVDLQFCALEFFFFFQNVRGHLNGKGKDAM